MKHVYICTGHELIIPNIVKSEGVYLFDDKEKRYMDLESGVWCTSIGHKNRKINGVITKQVDTLMHAGFCYSNKILEKSAKSILGITGFNNGKCVFLCSGSEAIEISRQISKHLSGKQISMTLHDSYLGAYSSIIDKTRNWYLLNWEQCKKCAKKEECNISCEVLQNIPKDVSEFIFEPGSASGFVRFPPQAFIKNVTDIVRGNNGRIVANEVTTGVGRTGKWFGYQHYSIKPDFIAVGKGVGNGYPVSITLINEAIMEELEFKPFKYAQSHQNDPLGAAIVEAVIQYIEANSLIAEAESKGNYFFNQLESLVDNKVILEVRGRGLMIAVDLVNAKVGDEIYKNLINKGYIVGNRGTSFRIDPPLTITGSEIDEFVRAFNDVLSEFK